MIVAGTTGAESFDLLVPYEILATSGAFNVYTVGPERRPLPLFPASPTLRGAHFVPHYELGSPESEALAAGRASEGRSVAITASMRSRR